MAAGVSWQSIYKNQCLGKGNYSLMHGYMIMNLVPYETAIVFILELKLKVLDPLVKLNV